jgi:peroxiredoxin
MRMMILFATVLASSLAVSARGAATVGAAAPGFTLTNQEGKQVSLAELKGKVVVLEWWNERCPVSARHAKAGTMKELAGRYADKGVVWLAVNSTEGSDVASNAKAAAAVKLNYAILDDAKGAVGKAYGAQCTPHMFVIDKAGKLAYAGAIDDDADGEKKPEARANYVARAIEALLAGKTVETAETKPYGCGVKYAE